MISKYATAITDQWDYHDVSRSYVDASAAGGMRPVVNSHYARQLNMWAIPLALSGQQFDARGSHGAVLSFDRRDPTTFRRWPVLTPGGLAIASDDGIGCAGGLSLLVLAGELRLREVWLEGALVATHVTVSAEGAEPAAARFCSSDYAK